VFFCILMHVHCTMYIVHYVSHSNLSICILIRINHLLQGFPLLLFLPTWAASSPTVRILILVNFIPNLYCLLVHFYTCTFHSSFVSSPCAFWYISIIFSKASLFFFFLPHEPHPPPLLLLWHCAFVYFGHCAFAYVLISFLICIFFFCVLIHVNLISRLYLLLLLSDTYQSTFPRLPSSSSYHTTRSLPHRSCSCRNPCKEYWTNERGVI